MNDAFPNSADTPESLPLGSAAAAPYGRPSWSGLLQFSLVGIPLKAFPAVRSRDVPSAHLLHAACGQRLRYAKQCPTHGPVEAAAIVRGYEYGPGQHVRIEPEELDQLRPAQDRAFCTLTACYADAAHMTPYLPRPPSNRGSAPERLQDCRRRLQTRPAWRKPGRETTRSEKSCTRGLSIRQHR